MKTDSLNLIHELLSPLNRFLPNLRKELSSYRRDRGICLRSLLWRCGRGVIATTAEGPFVIECVKTCHCSQYCAAATVPDSSRLPSFPDGTTRLDGSASRFLRRFPDDLPRGGVRRCEDRSRNLPGSLPHGIHFGTPCSFKTTLCGRVNGIL